ncbi:transcriptional regulator [Salmonirosea aquatica]|uniref:Transcriptional regulator n=1 Tax=Salmonirosea aquatica TaxID=2654236 RepID=A0A7C9F654_9BACT|nr:transcriptional regulator [Cytophagaceae bacterium SJW1-29]
MSFPEGVMQAHQKLHSLLPSVEGRNFYGISRPSDSKEIIYRAAVEEAYTGEAEKYGCEAFTIKKGDYLSETLTNWREDEKQIGETFQKLLADPRLDPEGYCLEVYVSDDEMRCMVPLRTL